MPPTIEKLAVLFADICGSTALYETLGDDLARRLILRCINTMSGKIAAYQGKLIKTIGDEIMCTFPSAEAAFHAASAIQAAVENERLPDGGAMHIRIGFNYGEVINESNDVYGNTVNVAARVVAITRADQIMATRAVLDALPDNLRGKMRQILRAEFKGLQDRLDIYQVISERENPLSTRIGIPAYRKSAETVHEMILRYRHHTVTVNKQQRSAVLGRDESCSLAVQNDLASRLHCRIELRFGKFIITDQSTNGTYIRSSDGSVVHITREEAVLRGHGSVSLGVAFSDHPTDLVEYSVISTEDQS
ncbi:MAG: Adenylate/guanylate cyclase [Candidatus Gallionella acididurans]|uniref:Adenylate/guanylate cyclase n=1 Tax=Candidatus Gallionella acididurans TaxID=1796491 RepID=A0A139BWR4_9PROT|nr:MAG: Adenylate/guanylate cyclase [Candidatus Gallionella acididurans]